MREPVVGLALMVERESSYDLETMLPLVQADIHLLMSCPKADGVKTGSTALVASWVGILDRSRRATKSGLRTTAYIL